MLTVKYIHLLAIPPIAWLLQELARGYDGQFDARHRHAGTLWKGRHKPSLLDQQKTCTAMEDQIGLKPIRTHMTDALAA